MIGFAYPDLFLLLLLPLLVYYLAPSLKGLHGDALRVTFIKDLMAVVNKTGIQGGGGKFAATSHKWRKVLLWLIYILLVTAVARPQWVGEPIRVRNEGRDILMVMDISTSMREPDFTLNGRRSTRLQAVKTVAADFIDKRVDDRIGLVLFGSRAYLQSPLTFDHQAVKNILWSMDAGMAGNSTAIGDALGLALKSIKDSADKSEKVIILLTDGENNDGALSLPQAINLAKNEKVKIYTIGVGGADSLMQSILSYAMSLPPELDDKSLQAIADETSGRYFKASNTVSLQKVYAEIDRLEPRPHDDNYVREVREYGYIPELAAVVLSLLLMFFWRKGEV